MMEFLDSLLCMFTSRVERRNGSYIVEIPEQELDVGALEEDQVYKVGLFPATETENSAGRGEDVTGQAEPSQLAGKHQQSPDEPPVKEGDIREVEIEDIGEKGDGIARIPPGYVVFVENTSPGDRVRIKITEAQENFAFAEVIKNLR